MQSSHRHLSAGESINKQSPWRKQTTKEINTVERETEELRKADEEETNRKFIFPASMLFHSRFNPLFCLQSNQTFLNLLNEELQQLNKSMCGVISGRDRAERLEAINQRSVFLKWQFHVEASRKTWAIRKYKHVVNNSLFCQQYWWTELSKTNNPIGF